MVLPGRELIRNSKVDAVPSSYMVHVPRRTPDPAEPCGSARTTEASRTNPLLGDWVEHLPYPVPY